MDANIHNCTVANNQSDRESLTTVLSPIGDVTDRFTFPMNQEGYTYFANRVRANYFEVFHAPGMEARSRREMSSANKTDIGKAAPMRVVIVFLLSS